MGGIVQSAAKLYTFESGKNWNKSRTKILNYV